MARENQGLQIALIIFVMLTVVLGVTTFLFYRKYDAALKDMEAAKNDAAENRNAAKKQEAEAGELKRLVGMTTKSLADIQAQFRKDMDTYSQNFPEDARYYSPLVARLWEAIDDRSKELTTEKVALQDLKNRYEAREVSTKGQYDKYDALIAEGGKTLAGVTQAYKAERDRIVADQTTLAQQMERVRKEQSERVTKAETKVTQATTRLAEANKLVDDGRRRSCEKFSRPTMDSPLGDITWVDQRSGTVWINLGRMDGLETRVTFSVYSADASELGKASKKASIEVTRIEGDHSAQARVLDDKVADPITPGDKIFTPLWTPGEHPRFALAGVMDIDGDGQNAVAAVRNLITMNGGAIDSEIDATGKRIGDMTLNTRYLVLGSEPKGEALTAYSRMIGDAERLGIRKITLAELKEKMGYKKQMGVQRFGPGSPGVRHQPEGRERAPAEAGRRRGQSRRPPSPVVRPRSRPARHLRRRHLLTPAATTPSGDSQPTCDMPVTPSEMPPVASLSPQRHALHPLFSPKSVAVVGVTPTPGTVPYDIFHNILTSGYRGTRVPGGAGQAEHLRGAGLPLRDRHRRRRGPGRDRLPGRRGRAGPGAVRQEGHPRGDRHLGRLPRDRAQGRRARGAAQADLPRLRHRHDRPELPGRDQHRSRACSSTPRSRGRCRPPAGSPS